MKPFALTGCLSLSLLGAFGADWPQFLGPARDGSTPEQISTDWDGSGPRVAWSREVGAGFSGPVAAGDRLILHQRSGDEEVLECFHALRGGEPLWRHAYPTAYRDSFGFDEGPRGTPAIHGDRVYAFGAEGVLTCVGLANGRKIWSVAAGREFGADKGYFGFACSPLVTGGLVMVNLGGDDGAGIAAFDAATGQLRWKATQHEAGYASPVAATIGGEPQAVFFTREGLVLVDPRSGRVRGEFPWRSRQGASVNAATPLVLGEQIFLTASYGTGAVLLNTDGARPAPVWSRDDSLSSHYASVVHRDGFIYGFHGRQEYGPSLRCIEAATGKVRWSKDDLGAGTVLLAGDCLLILSERGELIAGDAVPRAFSPKARAQVLGTGVRAFPALAGGFFYARDQRRMVCLDLRPRR
jgi:outer membrane protein assembly factor BamB